MNKMDKVMAIIIVLFYGMMGWATIEVAIAINRAEVIGWNWLLVIPYGAWVMAHAIAIAVLLVCLVNKVGRLVGDKGVVAER